MTDGQSGRERREVVSASGASAAGAAIGLVGGPLGALAGAALGPLLQHVALSIWEKRRLEVSVRWTESGVDQEALTERAVRDGAAFDLLWDGLSEALRTDFAAKRRVLADAMAAGLLTDDKVVESAARRLIRALGRVDEVEILVLSEVGARGPLTSSELRNTFSPGDGTVVDVSLAVLSAEGLVVVDGTSRHQVTDFGALLLAKLREVE